MKERKKHQFCLFWFCELPTWLSQTSFGGELTYYFVPTEGK